MTNLILAAIILIVVGAAVAYIIKEKKKGAVCIGCSHSGCCAGKKQGESGCGCQ